MICYACNGSGYKNQFICNTCNRQGILTYYNSCGICSSSGKINCSYCSGAGNLTCYSCGTDGIVSCYSCGGDGVKSCSYC